MGSLQGTKGQDMMETAAHYLGMAFDTTFVALVLSLILMYLLHRVQSADDTLLVRATDGDHYRRRCRLPQPEAYPGAVYKAVEGTFWKLPSLTASDSIQPCVVATSRTRQRSGR